jgi:hypothetical protein
MGLYPAPVQVWLGVQYWVNHSYAACRVFVSSLMVTGHLLEFLGESLWLIPRYWFVKREVVASSGQFGVPL